MNDISDLQRLGTAFCLDTETAMAPLCFQPGQLRLVQLHNEDATLWYDVTALSRNEWKQLAAFLQRPDLEITGQALNFDYRVLFANGVTLQATLYDTMIASALYYNGLPKMSHSLAEISRRELGRVVDKTLQTNDWMNARLTAEELRYALVDVEVTWEAAKVLHERIYANGLFDVYRLECDLIPCVAQMEHRGMPVSLERLRDAEDDYLRERESFKALFLETLDSRLMDEGHPRLPREEDGSFNTRIKDSGSIRLGTKRLAGFNINSGPQVLLWWKYLNIEPQDEDGKATTDKKVLAKMQSEELVRLYTSYRKVEKRLGMVQKLAEHTGEDGRIRARFMPLATGTGRFSSSGPNLQQVPRDPLVRDCFRAPAGRVLVQADYAAMELRVAAAIAEEQNMLKAFSAGEDIHAVSASSMFGVELGAVTKEQRQQAKALNFGALYGSSAQGIQNYCASIGQFISFRQASELLGRWHQAYPAFGRWHKLCKEQVDRGSPVRTRIGRRRQLKGEGNNNRVTVFANNWVQGTSADITKAAMISIHRQLPPNAWLIATIHDELILECDEADGDKVLELTLREMEAAAIPILGGICRIIAEGGVIDNWGQK